jgi:hypothetical protein
MFYQLLKHKENLVEKVAEFDVIGNDFLNPGWLFL